MEIDRSSSYTLQVTCENMKLRRGSQAWRMALDDFSTFIRHAM